MDKNTRLMLAAFCVFFKLFANVVIFFENRIFFDE